MDAHLRAVQDLRGRRLTLELLLLRVGFSEYSELKAYKALLRSSIPAFTASCPSTSNIAAMAKVYLDKHSRLGKPLPYFQPYNVTELNLYSSITQTDYVVYRQTGRKRVRNDNRRPLQTVADTRLFSGNPAGSRTAHIVIGEGAARKLNARGTAGIKVSEMLPNVSAKEVLSFSTPAELLRHLRPGREGAYEHSFLAMRDDVAALDEFATAIDRPVRLLAVNCTSRFKRDEKARPRRVACRLIEQSASNCGAGPALAICLQARSTPDGRDFAAEGLINFPVEHCGPRKAGKSGGTVTEAVEHKKFRSGDGEEEIDDAEPLPPKPLKRKLACHKRLDPCCRVEDEGSCEACEQMAAAHKKAKRPPVDSNRFLYNPCKQTRGCLAEARSLGLCNLFPWLEEAIDKCNIMGCTSMDIETLNVLVGSGSSAGSVITMAEADEVAGGTVTLTRHVPFMIGSSSFKCRAVENLSGERMLWSLGKQTSVFRMFTAGCKDQVPDQDEVNKCVSDWLDYILRRRLIVSQRKRKLLRPAIDFLRALEKRSDAFMYGGRPPKKKKSRNPAFRFSVYGKLLGSLLRLVDTVHVITFNGSKFDLPNTLSSLVEAAQKRRMKDAINKKGKRRSAR